MNNWINQRINKWMNRESVLAFLLLLYFCTRVAHCSSDLCLNYPTLCPMAFRFWYNNNKISYDVCCLLVSPKCSVILKDNQDVCCLQNIIKMFIKCNVTEILIVRSQMSATYKTFARTRSLLNVLLVLDHLLVDLVRSTEGTPQPYWNKLWNRWLCLAKCSNDHHVKNNSKTTVQTMMTYSITC